MALDPRTQMAQAHVQEGEKASPGISLISHPPTTSRKDQRPMTAKRRKLHALTEALFDPCTTMEEADLEALMRVAKRRTPRKRPGL